MEAGIQDFNIVETDSPMPTIEIDTDSSSCDDYREEIEKCLCIYADKHKKDAITIYSYVTPSVNFGRYTNSVFFIVANSQKLRDYLYSFLSKNGNFNIRLGESIPPSQGTLDYHMEKGSAWRQDDAITFTLLGTDDDECDAGDKGHDADEDASSGQYKALRKYRARDDAKIGTIKKAIENVFGLPSGCVALCVPDGSKLRADAKIRTLRSRWSEE